MIEDQAFRKAKSCQQDCCVAVGAGSGLVGVRDTKQLNRTSGQYEGPTLAVPAAQWRSFLGQVRRGIDWD